MAHHADIFRLIGNTPMIQVQRMDTGCCQLFLKLESQNPGGSIKDRPALYMIEAAEKAGLIKPGGLLVEATAGNTGLGLGLIARMKGYRLLIVMPDKMSQEKICHLRALGAEVVMTRSDVNKGHPDYYQDKAERITRETPGAFYVNQFANEANVAAHQNSTAPEIWQQMEHDVDAVVVGVGTGATLSGIGRFMNEVSPKTEMILADPKGSILAGVVNSGKLTESTDKWMVEGIGEDFIPKTCELDWVKKAYTVTDRDAFLAARALLQQEGVFAGSSTGVLLTAALRYCREQTTPKRVVTFACDSGNKYLSKVYDDYWMYDHGFLERAPFHDLRDLIVRRHVERQTIIVSPADTLMTAYTRMKLHEVSQLPVVEGDEVKGIVDESDLLLAIERHQSDFQQPVSTAMSTRLEVIDYKAPIEDLMPIFAKNCVAIVMQEAQFLGIITRIDLLNHLRRKYDE